MKKCFKIILGIENVFFGLFLTLTIAVSVRGQWSGYVSPTFIGTNTNISAYVGTTVKLPCSVVNLGTKKVVWKRENEEHPLTIGDFVFTNDARFYIDHPARSYQWDLVIKDVTKDYSGIYDCQISTKEEMYRKIRLSVTDLPQVEREKAIQISGPNFTEKGEPIRITCNATSDSIVSDKMDWFRNGRKLRDSHFDGISITESRHKETRTLYSILEIKKSTMDDAGTYICRNSRRVVSHQVIVLNADSSHEKRGFQDKTEDNLSSSKMELSNNAAATFLSENHRLLSTCVLLLLILSAHNR